MRMPVSGLTELMMAGAIALSSGCAQVAIREQRVTVSDIRVSTANDIQQELTKMGYDVRLGDSTTKGSIFGDEIKDQTFLISGKNFTQVDLRRVTEQITRSNRRDPIVLTSTEVDQKYTSASGEGRAAVTLRVDLTGNGRAYYKATDALVPVTRVSGQQTATFSYERKKGEEYVDVYIVPDDAKPDFRPSTFLRFSLSSPYTTERLPWDPWYVRLWEALIGEKK